MTIKNVLVTGDAGLLGNHIANALKDDYTISGLDLREGSADIDWHVGQLGDAKFVTKAVEGIDAILHVAAIPNIWSEGAEEMMQTNVAALYHLFDAAEAAGDIYGV